MIGDNTRKNSKQPFPPPTLGFLGHDIGHEDLGPYNLKQMMDCALKVFAIIPLVCHHKLPPIGLSFQNRNYFGRGIIILEF